MYKGQKKSELKYKESLLIIDLREGETKNFLEINLKL